GTITLDTAVTTLNLNGGAVTIHDGDGIDIASITATSLDLLTAGGITDSGIVAITNLAKFNSTGNAIVLGDATTATFGSLDFAGSTVTITEGNAMVIEASEATGALTLVAGGSITQTGVIDSISTSRFDAGANVITLTQANDFAGAVSLSNTGTNLVQVTDANALDLGTVNVGGDLLVNTTGTITDTGNLTVVGLATLVSGGNAITLGDGTTANFGSIDFAGSTVAITEASDMSIAESEATEALSLTASGAISQTGRIDADNTSLFDNTGGTDAAITLDNANNDFTGAVSVTASDTGSDVSLKDVNAIDLGAVSVGDALTVSSTGAITDSANITVGGLATVGSGGNAITLGDGTTANFGSIDFAGSTVAITEASAMSLAASEATGALSLTASGAITQTGAIDADGTSSIAAGANAITLDAANDFTGAVSLSNTGANDVSITDSNALDLGTVDVGQNLTITTGGTLSDSATVSVPGLATIVATGQTVILGDSTTANFGSLDFAGAAVTITEDSAMEIAASEATGALSLTASGAITQTGAIDADGTSSFSAGANTITLTQANDFTGAVSLSNAGANDVSITDSNALILGTVGVGQNLTVTTTGGALTDSANIAVEGLATIVATGQSVTLGDAVGETTNFGSLDFAGAAVTITEDSSMSIAASEATGALTLSANGAITQTGAIAASSASSFTTSVNDATITLTDAANQFTGAVTLISTDSDGNNEEAVQLTNSIATILGGSTESGSLVVISNSGKISQTGALDVDTTSSFTAGTNEIDLSDATNEFSGLVTVTGGVTTLKDASELSASLTTSGTTAITAVNGLTVDGTVTGATSDLTTSAAVTTFGATTVGRNLSVTASGTVSDTDKLTVAGTSTISATGQSVELDTATNEFTGAVAVTGGATTLKDATDLTVTLTTTGSTSLTAVTGLTANGTITGATSDLTTSAAATSFGATAVGRNLSVTASGDVSQTGALDVDGISDIAAGSNAITLTEVANDFTGAVSLSNTGANDVSITDANALNLGTVSVGQDLTVTTTGGALTDSGNVSVVGLAQIVATGQNVILGDATSETTNFGSLDFSGATVSISEDSSMSIAASEATVALSLTSSADIIQTGEILAQDGATPPVGVASSITAGTNIVLDDADNVFGELTLNAGNEIAIRETGSMSGTAAAQSLQARATTGIELKSGTAVSKLAALSTEGAIKVANTGDLTISPVASFTNNLGLSGITLSGGTKANVEVVTKSPISVDAPIKNETVGKIILAAQGATATDDVTINSTITGDAVEVYAGDEISLSSTASLQVKDASATYTSLQVHDVTSTRGYGTTKLHYGTNYDSGVLSAGFALADDVVISDLATLESILEINNISSTKLVIYGPSRRLLYVGGDQNQEYFIALDPSVELAGEWNRSDMGNIFISNELTTGSFFQSEDEGSIEIEELEEK
ncbi:MAG: hypothetical protein HN627_10885, partial [Opitutae bacterium]|nr:hypothetical protein [Opitutae bacterium]